MSNKSDKSNMQVEDQINSFVSTFSDIKEQVQRVFFGQGDLVDELLTAFFAGGHVLLEGVPGVGKTVLARSMASAMNLTFERIQCTPDLMPADILGHKTLVNSEKGGHELIFQQGPIIAHYVLVDEVNRATPKTQAALLQAMQEGQITIGRETFDLPQPNIIIATQNPVEHSGTYPLPESEVDRFMVKLQVNYPEQSDYRDIISQTTSVRTYEPIKVADVDILMDMKRLVRSVHIVDEILDYAIQLVVNSQPENSIISSVREDIVLGAGPRAVQALVMTGKVRALLDGRMAVSKLDIKQTAHSVLRHRMLTHFSVISTSYNIDSLISEIIDALDKK